MFSWIIQTSRFFGLSLICCLLATPAFSSQNRFTTFFGQEFVRIPAGTFVMGTGEYAALAEEVPEEKLQHLKLRESPAHTVTISSDFYLSTTEITQKTWHSMMQEQPGKTIRWQREDWANLPVSRVSWDKVQNFIDTLNRQDTGYVYRLPTEAEWEYAARANSQGLRPFELSEMDLHAWYRENSEDKPMPVASREPNAFGLYDMLGNLWEWVEDPLDPEYYQNSTETDPLAKLDTPRRVMRGGSYHCTPERVRSAIRGSYVRHRSLSILGFRLVAEPRKDKQK